MDAEWRISSFNRAAERITGVPRAQALGHPCCEVFRASICEQACALKQTLTTGQPVINKMVEIVNAAGRRVPISISTAILKDAKGEIGHLIEKFNRLQDKEVAGPSDQALAGLMAHDCPGNVRELENIIEHAFVLCRRGLIGVRHLPAHLHHLLEKMRVEREQAGVK